eukprot:5632036-Prymnesium_polylepis.1
MLVSRKRPLVRSHSRAILRPVEIALERRESDAVREAHAVPAARHEGADVWVVVALGRGDHAPVNLAKESERLLRAEAADLRRAGRGEGVVSCEEAALARRLSSGAD